MLMSKLFRRKRKLTVRFVHTRSAAPIRRNGVAIKTPREPNMLQEKTVACTSAVKVFGAFAAEPVKAMIARYGVGFAAGLLLGRSVWVSGASPAVAAATAVGVRHEISPLAVVAGAAVGGLTRVGEGPSAFAPALSGALALGVQTALNRFHVDQSVVRDALIAAVVWLIAALALSARLPYDLFIATTGAALAGALAFAADRAIGALARGRTTTATTEEMVCVVLITAFLLTGLSDVRFGLFSPVRTLIYYAALIAATLAGAPGGAATGAMLGALMVLGGFDGSAFLSSPVHAASMTGALALGGVVGGCMKRWRIGVVIGSALGVGLCAALTPGLTSALPVIDMAIAMVMYLMLPRDVLVLLREFFDGRHQRISRDGEAAAYVGEKVGDMMRAMSEAYARMGKSLAEGVWDVEKGETHVRLRAFEEARRACASCSWRGECFSEERLAGTLRIHDAIFQEAESSTDTLIAVPAWIRKECLRPGELAQVMRAAMRIEDEKKRRTAVARQGAACLARRLCAVSGEIEALRTSGKGVAVPDIDLSAEIRDGLTTAGVRVQSVAASRADGRLSVTVERLSCGGRGECSMRVARAIEQVTGLRIAPADARCAMSSGCSCRKTYLERPAISCVIGAASLSADDGASGDCYGITSLRDGVMLAVLSDGMGSGAFARRESQLTVNLLTDMARVASDHEHMLRDLNELLLSRGGEEMYATVDACVFDLHRKKASVLRMGAAKGVIISGTSVTELGGASLPVGIIGDVTPLVETVDLSPGDVFVQVSDGIGGVDSAAWLRRALKGADLRNPQALAERILSAARDEGEQSGTPLRDDRTVLVTRIVGEQPKERHEARAQTASGNGARFMRAYTKEKRAVTRA